MNEGQECTFVCRTVVGDEQPSKMILPAVVQEVWGENWDVDVLPVHGVEHGS